MKSFYITTTIPYVNSDPHIGHALEFVQADVVARYLRLGGFDVFYNTGTDEHGLNIYTAAKERGKDTKSYADEKSARFAELLKMLNIQYDNFIRTTDEHHKMAAQEFWNRCLATGDIYKKEYKIKYCMGCEMEKTESELVNGRCPLHPNKEIHTIEEENFFFRFSKYQKPLLDLYEQHPDLVLPESRMNEIKKFVQRGLDDFSISRLAKKMPWGIPVPGEQDHVMYVWFDALVNYISAVGWPNDMEKFNKWWPVVQVAGKDNLRQQSAIWQAMLMSAQLPPSRQIIIHGFLTNQGVKMSKTLGNVVDPFDIISRYGTDAVRYYLIRQVTPFEDSDFSEESFKFAYNASLANGLGNLVSRILKMSSDYFGSEPVGFSQEEWECWGEYRERLESFQFDRAANVIWSVIADLDAHIQNEQPFRVAKDNMDKAKEILRYLVGGLNQVALMLRPIMPVTAETILEHIAANKMPEQPLFMRKD